jgi:tetratricopeptide (TPR) repeat protein
MDERERLYRRVLAGAGIALLVGGLLMALSLVLLGLAIVVATALALLVGAAVSGLRRVDTRPAYELAAASTAATARFARAHRPRPRIRQRGRTLATRAKSSAARVPHSPEAVVGSMYRVGLLQVRSIDPGTRAQELNQLGARLRRQGDPEQAAEQHREALEIVRDLGDQRAEALTLNSLGLALAHSGAEHAAVEYLEQAVDVLRELGDEEHEGQAIANLGLVYRRQGQADEAATLFQEALEKLPPSSPAHRRIEEELRRAG